MSISLVLASCATKPGEPGQPSARTDPLGALISREAGPAPSEDTRTRLPGPAAEIFVGQPVSRLEAVVGPPALVRREGANDFRRYDLENCRVYAVTAPAGGRVQTVSTGALVAGQAAPTFSSCTSGL